MNDKPMQKDVGRRPVVVGVGGDSRSSEAAVRYGVERVKRLGSVLRLVHVVPAYMPMAPMLPLPPENFEEAGRNLLETYAKPVRDQLPEGGLETVVLTGNRGHRLAEAAQDAEMLVVGQARHPVLDRLLTGATVATVAAHAQAPVVVVPAEWQPTSHGRVVVGVKSVGHAAPLVRLGLEVADTLGASLLLVHAWALPGQYDDIVSNRVDREEVATQVELQLQPAVAEAGADRPDVPVQIMVIHGQPASVLRDAAADADLMIITRRPRAFPAGYLGSTGRALLRSSRTPIEVLAAPGPDLPDLDLQVEGAGRMQR